MTPDFDEIVGTSEDESPVEVAELRRVHDLLASATPPPELSPRLARPPRVGPAPTRRLRRRPRLVAAVGAGLAAATALAVAFGAGYGINGGPGFQTSFTRSMRGVAPLTSASATIEVGRRDASGNWPLQMTVRGVPALPPRGWYDLYLTEHGKRGPLCGTFRAGAATITRVRMSTPYPLDETSGWVVTATVPGQGQRVLLTTSSASATA
jgi:hypothetical protein